MERLAIGARDPLGEAERIPVPWPETAAAYHHAWRDAGLSDHSALEVELRRTAAG